MACISGQQVGVLGGPLYSVLKAVSALQMAEELTAQGTEAIPLFWLATEDHDLAEIASVTLPNGCELEKLTATEQSGSEAPGGTAAAGAADCSGGGAGGAAAGAGMGERCAARELSRGRELRIGVCAAVYAAAGRQRDWCWWTRWTTSCTRIAQPLLAAAAERAEELDEALLERGTGAACARAITSRCG